MENKKPDLFEQEMELIQTRIMLNKLIQLNLSLYHAILNYAERKEIPISLDSTILQLVEEIEKTDIITFPACSTDESLHGHQNSQRLYRTVFRSPCEKSSPINQTLNFIFNVFER